MHCHLCLPVTWLVLDFQLMDASEPSTLQLALYTVSKHQQNSVLIRLR